MHDRIVRSLVAGVAALAFLIPAFGGSVYAAAVLPVQMERFAMADNAVFKKILATGEEQFGKIAAQLVSNEKFVASLQVAVTRALEAKGSFDRQVSSTLAAMHVPTTHDVAKLNDRLEELERIFEGLSTKVDSIMEKLDEKPRG